MRYFLHTKSNLWRGKNRCLMSTLTALVLLWGIFIIFSPSHAYAQLGIHPDNPHYLTYRGQPIFLISGGSSKDIENNFSHYADHGVNNFRLSFGTRTTDPKGTPYSGKRMDNKTGSALWNDQFWQTVKGYISNAEKRRAIVGLRLWGTSYLENCRTTPNCGRWDTQVWNCDNGGPICDLNGNGGKDEFYDFESFGTFIYGNQSYQSNWSQKKKNQYRQEELMAKFLTEFAGFDNYYIGLMWEMHDTGGASQSKAIDWFNHMADFVHQRSTGIFLTTFEASGCSSTGCGLMSSWLIFDNLDFVALQNRPTLRSGMKQLKDTYWNKKRPFIHLGTRWAWHKDPDVSPDKKAVKRSIREMVLNGLNPAADFRAGGFSYNEEVIDYLLDISNFIKTIDTWCDEPDQEIRDGKACNGGSNHGQDCSSNGECNSGACEDIVPSTSGIGGVDLPPGSCQDSIGGSQCNDDGTCDPGENSFSCPNDCYCGNPTIDPGEQCEGSNLNNQTCELQGFPGGGTLSCNNSTCRFDYSACIGVCDEDDQCELSQGENSGNCPKDCFCGDGVCEPGENCTVDCGGGISGNAITCSDISSPTVNSQNSYQCQILSEGSLYYTDRTTPPTDYKLVTVPDELEGTAWIKTPNDDKSRTDGEGFLIVTPFKDVTVYVAYDPRGTPPNWLSSSNGWTSTGQQVAVTDAVQFLNLYQRSYSATQQISLGGNNSSGSVPPTGGGSNYVVAILEDTTSGLNQPPQKPSLQIRP